VTAPKVEALAGDAAQGSEGAVENSATADSAVIVAQDAEACRAARDAHDKFISTLRAKFAMRGYELHIIGDGFYITRWGMGRTAHTLADLEAFAAQVGVPL
jgi:hypothetical protein